MRKITRRELLVQSTALAAGYGLSRSLTKAQFAQANPLPLVAVGKGTDKDSEAAILKTALDAVGGIERFVQPGQTVCIKPNATWAYPAKTASSTDPDLLRALVLMVKGAGAKRIVLVDRLTLFDYQACMETTGIGKALEGLPVEIVFPDGYNAPDKLCTEVEFPNAKTPDFKRMRVLKAAVESDVRINMGVAKSHLVVPVTLSLKHMMGFLQMPSMLHAQLEQGIADLNGPSPIHADLHILEALRVRLPFGAVRQAGGTQTELTHPRIVKRFNEIVAGTDPVLIDAYACVNYFERQPKEIRYIAVAGATGLGEMDAKLAAADGRLIVQQVGQPAGMLVAAESATATSTLSATTTATATTASTGAPVPATNTPAATMTNTTPQPAATGSGTPEATPTATTPPTATATPEPSATPTATLPPSPQETNTVITSPPPTNTPRPTEVPDPASQSISTGHTPADAGRGRLPDAQNFNRVLSGALLPVAAIVAGAGLAVGRRLRAEEAPAGAEPSAETRGQDDDGRTA